MGYREHKQWLLCVRVPVQAFWIHKHFTSCNYESPKHVVKLGVLQGCVLRHSYFIPTRLIGKTAFEGLLEKIKRMQNEVSREIVIHSLT